MYRKFFALLIVTISLLAQPAMASLSAHNVQSVSSDCDLSVYHAEHSQGIIQTSGANDIGSEQPDHSPAITSQNFSPSLAITDERVQITVRFVTGVDFIRPQLRAPPTTV
ncbi:MULTISPECIES: hypothetical protein [Idiomarina]|jgi:hypothetical protein|uniref:Uncharacterized protein n=2 Tax=Idiomarina baltica TaxID=190892 RepID=A0A348WMI4_9GAMM|nr:MULTISPECIES: hypothetical protein [Idiomarina]MAF76305.1 hypothetical protein [Idiomarinaceae bacterium]MEC8925783.1 hypothetical protein [Pseudomonadota bacterium]EAQ30877.1 hypothetical protein OS145_05825 [Idiomarina baltica OS145]KXS34998.1 MAG: Uncharacterized protein AWU56_1413 [Idiomarina sp. T82-3]MBL73676.1 hypothetical protein [Idiomarinaceae bacterium]|tara:strand:+ start:1690 stop:2019 length:330 start_codon:yes stop_codon:yes gene_type:complete